MRHRLLPALIAASLWLSGCELLVSSPTPLSQNGTSLHLRTEILPGGYRPQALVKAYTGDDIDHLTLQLFRLDGATETPVIGPDAKPVIKHVPAAKLEETLTFEALQPFTTYRIRAFAYQAPGDDPKDLISAPDSATDVTLSDDDRSVITLKVKLADVPFNGIATAPGIEVIPGGFTSHGPVDLHIGDALNLVPFDDPFWATFLPNPVPGMAWVYEVTQTSGGVSTEGTFREEIIAVDDLVVGYRSETTLGSETDLVNSYKSRSVYHGSPLAFSNLIREEEEAVSVPHGTYPQAIRFVSQEYAGKTTVWIVQGIGMVKATVTPSESDSSDDVTVIQLQQFITP